uniref:NADH-ubiquinone oxidoreductase chain 5 n=1 Tax=Marsupiomonas sp. NIES 1824 TaxID=1562198 RepID=A0A6H0R1Z6_9CHLO|nr:NADH dehydrogenase subunit 5 [Marsupiomonas sp. NIES 1824]
MYRLLGYFPLAGARVCGMGGRWLGGRGRRRVRTSCLRSTRLLSWAAFYEVGVRGVQARVSLRSWFERDAFQVQWRREVDRLTRVMVRLVTTVSTLVHLYSAEYLRKDPHLPRFFSYLSFFTFTMMVLVTRRDLVQLFFGWEGVGVASFLLIHFWTRRARRNSGANKAMIYNRVGDLRLALGSFRAFELAGRVDFATLSQRRSLMTESQFHLGSLTLPRGTTIRILLLLGAMGKSAQLSLHPWLPDAMEGPTPVSALIHAATMVTAGVYLLARTHPLRTEGSQRRVRRVGARTALFAVSVGSGQKDLKRMIAYSTCSQLGFMVFACGAGQFARAMFHLFTHGFYKRLLFLARGSVIHARRDEQDVRRLGGRSRSLPLTTTALMIGSFALRGFPFRAGFYSKDLILETAEGVGTVMRAPLALTTSLAAYGTAYYSTTLIWRTFLGAPKGPKRRVAGRQEPGLAMALPLVVLTTARRLVGWRSEDLLVGRGTLFWGSRGATALLSERLLSREYHSWKVLPLVLSRLARGLRILASRTRALATPRERASQNFLSRRWGMDRVFHETFASPRFHHGWATTYGRLDQGLLERRTPERRSDRRKRGSSRIRRLPAGVGGFVGRMFRRRVLGMLLSGR